MIAGIAAVASIATVFAFAPATHAIGLDNINLGTTLSSQDGDESRGLNLGLEAVDHLENLGLG